MYDTLMKIITGAMAVSVILLAFWYLTQLCSAILEDWLFNNRRP